MRAARQHDVDWLCESRGIENKTAMKLTGRGGDAHRLFDSLQVDIQETTEKLGWKPPYTVEEGLRRCLTG